MCSPSWTSLPPPSPYHPSGSSQCTSPKHPVSCIKHGLAIVPGGSDGKASACNAGDLGLIPGLWRSPGEGYGNPLQYSCLENSMDREAWWATVWLCIFGKLWGFCGGSDCKESACNAGDLGLIPELGRFPGGGQNNPLVSLPRESHGQRSQTGHSPRSQKESNMT